MSTLSTIKTRLSSELADSEITNKTDAERTQAINDATRLVYKYRTWPNLYVNSDLQAVDGIFNIPRNMDKPSVIWFGMNTDYFWQLNFINQTDFLKKYPYTITKTDYNGTQVLKLEDTSNRGHEVYNYTGTSTIGINDVVAHTQVGQTFVATDATLQGVMLKLNTVGSPEGTLTVDIKATAGGLPTGSSLATATIQINEITSTAEYFWKKFTAAVALTEASTYSITVTPSYSTDASNYVEWTYSTTSQITGSQVLYDGGTWSLGSGDQVFVLCDDYYNFQYTTKFIDLENASDDMVFPEDFDRAIAKMAAGIISENKGKIDKANIKYYGAGGNQMQPVHNSAFGILNLLWTDSQEEATRVNRRIKTFYESGRNFRYRYNDNYYPNL